MNFMVTMTVAGGKQLASSDLALGHGEICSLRSSYFGWCADDLPLRRHMIEDHRRAKLRHIY